MSHGFHHPYIETHVDQLINPPRTIASLSLEFVNSADDVVDPEAVAYGTSGKPPTNDTQLITSAAYFGNIVTAQERNFWYAEISPVGYAQMNDTVSVEIYCNSMGGYRPAPADFETPFFGPTENTISDTTFMTASQIDVNTISFSGFELTPPAASSKAIILNRWYGFTLQTDAVWRIVARCSANTIDYRFTDAIQIFKNNVAQSDFSGFMAAFVDTPPEFVLANFREWLTQPQIQQTSGLASLYSVSSVSVGILFNTDVLQFVGAVGPGTPGFPAGNIGVSESPIGTAFLEMVLLPNPVFPYKTRFAKADFIVKPQTATGLYTLFSVMPLLGIRNQKNEVINQNVDRLYWGYREPEQTEVSGFYDNLSPTAITWNSNPNLLLWQMSDTLIGVSNDFLFNVGHYVEFTYAGVEGIWRINGLIASRTESGGNLTGVTIDCRAVEYSVTTLNGYAVAQQSRTGVPPQNPAQIGSTLVFSNAVRAIAPYVLYEGVLEMRPKGAGDTLLLRNYTTEVVGTGTTRAIGTLIDPLPIENRVPGCLIKYNGERFSDVPYFRLNSVGTEFTLQHNALESGIGITPYSAASSSAPTSLGILLGGGPSYNFADLNNICIGYSDFTSLESASVIKIGHSAAKGRKAIGNYSIGFGANAGRSWGGEQGQVENLPKIRFGSNTTWGQDGANTILLGGAIGGTGRQVIVIRPRASSNGATLVRDGFLTTNPCVAIYTTQILDSSELPRTDGFYIDAIRPEAAPTDLPRSTPKRQIAYQSGEWFYI